MIVLDTNVVSELMRAAPNADVVSWVDAQADLYLTSVTAAELLYGVARMPPGRRRSDLASAAAELLEVDFADRVLPFDLDATVEYAEIVVRRERSGRPIGLADAMVAAIARSAGASALATRNVKDFSGLDLEVVDPWAPRA